MTRTAHRLLWMVALVNLTGCHRPSAPSTPARPSPAAPVIMQTWTSGPVVATALVHRADRAPRILAVAQDGTSQWIEGARSVPGPGLPANISRLVAADLDGDRQDELLLGATDRVAAYDPDGRRRWDYPTGGAKVLDLAAADIGDAGETLVFVAGQPPLGLTALAPDGQLAWHSDRVRTAYSLAPLPTRGEINGLLYCIADDDLVSQYDALGQAAGTRQVVVGPEQRPVQATGIVLLTSPDGPSLLVIGRVAAADGERPTWVQTQLDGATVAAGELPALPDVDRARVLAGRFAGGETDLAAVPSRKGELCWLRPGADQPVSEPWNGTPLCLAVGPEAHGRATLLAGTSIGLVQLGLD